MRTQSTIEGIGRNGVRGVELFATEPTVVPSTSDPALGVPVREDIRVEPVRWSVVVAGVFAALSALTLLAFLAAAIGLPPFLPQSLRLGTVETGLSVGPFIVAGIVAILGFGFGGWVASRLSILHTLRTSLLCGALVWAVTVPALLIGFTARRAMMPQSDGYAAINPNGELGTGMEYGTTDPRLVPGVRPDIQPRVRVPETPGEARAQLMLRGEHVQRMDGVIFVSLLLAFGASLIGGLLGQGRIRRDVTGVREREAHS